MTGAPLHIAILGGGTAGWMTACLMAHKWHARGVRISVIESPDIGIIGVGEGSTPQLKAFFDRLDIAESEWMPACDATYKLGIRFTGWSERQGYESYFHPFPGPVDLHSEPAFVHNCRLRRGGADVEAHPDRFYLAALLANQKRGPHPADSFPFPPTYGYHFDAYKVGAFLKDKAEALGVMHLQHKIAEVKRDTQGDVSHLLAEDGAQIDADFFVDCSGFRSMIAGQALGGEFISFENNLFNDSAVVMPGEVEADGSVPIATTATAMQNGWLWHIPLTSRSGNGYVYASRYTDADDAETEMRAKLGRLEDETPARHLKMRVGRVRDSWHRNCLAMGLAQGFVEPLEATALHIVIATADEFIAAFEAGNFTPQHREHCNAKIGRRYDGIRDYIVAHYRMNQRSDTEYWRDNASHDNLSDSLKALMTCWFTGGDMNGEIAQQDIARYYASISWHCLFAGYGTFPADEKLHAADPRVQPADTDAVTDILSRAAQNFAPHHDMLAKLKG